MVNVVRSKDGRISIPFQDVKFVCICYSLYPLLQYLLLMDEDMIKKHTCFFFGSEVPPKIRCQLPCFCYETGPVTNFMKKIKRIMEKLYLRVAKTIKYPFLNNAKFYAQDFGYLSILIGKRSYSMLAEAPNHLNYVGQEDSFDFQRVKRKSQSLKGKAEALLFGQVVTRYHGCNDQCEEFFFTEETDAVAMRNKVSHVDSFKSLWDKSTDSKRDFILSVFDLTLEDKMKLASCPIVFLSQAWVNDSCIKEEDYVSLLQEVFGYYDKKDIIIKRHPRDTFDYEKYFPDISVFSKPISMQLLVLVAFNIKKVVTFSSTAVDVLPENVEIDWFGTPMHKIIRPVSEVTPVFNRPYNKINWK